MVAKRTLSYLGFFFLQILSIQDDINSVIDYAIFQNNLENNVKPTDKNMKVKVNIEFDRGNR